MQIWTQLIFIYIICTSEIISMNNLGKENKKMNGIVKWQFEKRPFCNAFTGCGKKRNFHSEKRNEPSNAASQALSELIDINAEPSVENVQKQIMSQAKIYEAIKEASKEILFQQSKHKMSGTTKYV